MSKEKEQQQLSEQQKTSINNYLAKHFNPIKYPNDGAQKLRALESMLKYNDNLPIEEAAGLSMWQAKVQTEEDSASVPLLPSVLYLRSALKDPTQINEISEAHTEAARKYITTHINARIHNLKNYEQVDKKNLHPKKRVTALKSAEIPPLTLKSTATFFSTAIIAATSDMKLGLEVANLLYEESKKASNNIIHSENKTIRYAINYGMKGAMSGISSGNPLIFSPEPIVGAIAGGIGGAIVSLVPKEYQKFTDLVVDAAIDGLVSKSRTTLAQVAYASLLATMTGASVAYMGGDSNMSGIAAASAVGYSGKHDVYEAFLSGIGKAYYNLAWRTSSGGAALDKRNLQGFIYSRVISTESSKTIKEVIKNDSNFNVLTTLAVGAAILTSVENYRQNALKISQDKNTQQVLAKVDLAQNESNSEKPNIFENLSDEGKKQLLKQQKPLKKNSMTEDKNHNEKLPQPKKVKKRTH